MKRFIFALLVSVTTLTASGQDYRALMQKAVREGRATTEVTGQVAEQIRALIKRPNAKVMLDVTRVDDQTHAGCHGLRLRFTTPGTLLPVSDGTHRELDLGALMNICPKTSVR